MDHTEYDVFIECRFAEPQFVLVGDQEDGESFVIGNAFVQEPFVVFGSAIGFAILEDENSRVFLVETCG